MQVRQICNGPESFTPDNNFIMGEAPEMRHLFVAAGFNSVGIARGGGGGEYLGEWVLGGGPTVDLLAVENPRVAPRGHKRTFPRRGVTGGCCLDHQMAL